MFCVWGVDGGWAVTPQQSSIGYSIIYKDAETFRQEAECLSGLHTKNYIFCRFLFEKKEIFYLQPTLR